MNSFKRKSPFAAVLAALVLSGCQGFGAPRMSADELRAAARDRNASVACASYDSLPVDGAVLYVNIDAAVVAYGKLDVKCGSNTVVFTNSTSPFAVGSP